MSKGSKGSSPWSLGDIMSRDYDNTGYASEQQRLAAIQSRAPSPHPCARRLMSLADPDNCLSDTEIAENLGISRRTLLRYRRGGVPRQATARLTQALYTTPDHIHPDYYDYQ